MHISGLTLDQIWERCISMWEWIVDQKKAIGKDTSIVGLKRMWLEQNHPTEWPSSYCYFCQFAEELRGGVNTCEACPGKIMDEKFVCTNPEYHYNCKPETFLRKVKELNEKRIARKNTVL